MKERALGNIETYGLVPAIEAADAALKAANVELIKCEYVRAGLVTIFIVGDVSAVQSSVDAGKAAAERVGTVISTNVIARMAESLDKIIFDDIDEKEEEILESEEIESEEDTIENEESEKLEKTEEVESEEDVLKVFPTLNPTSHLRISRNTSLGFEKGTSVLDCMQTDF